MSQLILREEALRHCTLLEESDHRVLIIQAQAGQGKTVLATQFEEASETPFAWTTCTRIDAAPRPLFHKILNATAEQLPHFAIHDVQSTLQQQLMGLEFIDISSRRFGAELEKTGAPVVLVFDDVHLLDESDQTKQLLQQLVAATPEYIQFIFISRFPLTLDDAPMFPPAETLTIDRSLLAFSREEIAILYNDVFNDPANTSKINQLLEATEGWVSGLKLLHTSGTIRKLVHADNVETLGSFFDELILPALSPAEQQELALLALLDDLPSKLLNTLGSLGVVSWIQELVTKNCFARMNREEGQRVYRLHHIFQEYLVGQTDTLVSPKEKNDFLLRAGHWHLKNNRTTEGLNCFIKAENWHQVAETLKLECLPLLAASLHQSIMDVLGQVPDEIIHKSGWLSFSYGATQLSLEPGSSAPHLERAITLFRDDNDQFGELLAACSLLNFHVLISGEFGRKASIVQRAAELFEAIHEQLPGPIEASCAQALALGRTYYESKMKEASEYARIAEKFYRDSDETVDPWFLITRVLVLGLKGEIEHALDLLSPLFKLVNTPWISPTTRFSLLVIQVNFLCMAGRRDEYHALCTRLKRDWKIFMEQSYLGVFITVWDLDMLISEGKYEEALTRAAQCPYANSTKSSHMICQIRHYEMLALAHLGRFDEMDRKMKEALHHRAKGGGPYFIHLTHSLTMASLSLAGRDTASERIFQKCDKIVGSAPALYHGQLVYSYRASMHLRQGNRGKAITDVRHMLNFMTRTSNRHFFGWSPRVMKQSLSLAVQENIHPEYARMLARKQMGHDILDNGTQVPLMQIQVIGDMRISLGDASIEESDLSPTWKQVLTQLAMAQGHSLDTKVIQKHLWPNEDPESSRSKFDTMLSRLRSRLSKTFGKNTIKRHIQVKSQRLQLKHCQIDADMVDEYAREGIGFAQENKIWRADNAFTCMSQWLGKTFDAPATLNTLPPSLLQTISTGLAEWLKTLEDANAQDKALVIANKALGLDPINDSLQRKRYNLLISLKRPGEAARSLKEYRTHLQGHDFDAEEIDHIIDSLLTIEQGN